MSRKPTRAAVVAGIVALLLLVGGGAWWWTHRRAAPAPSAAPAARDTGDILAVRRAARAHSDAQGRTPAAAAGTVRDASTHAAIAGALVMLTPATLLGARDDQSGEAAAPLYARTDAQGGFTLAKVLPGRYHLSASAPGYLPAQKLDVLIRPGEPRTGLDLVLAAGGHSLSGTVTDVGGGPVAGALVSARLLSGASLIGGGDAPAAALSDERGSYRIDLAEGAYDVRATHADYVDGAAGVTVRGGPATLDFVLTPGASVQGVVLSRADRRPVAGAIVRAAGGRASMENLSDLSDVAVVLGAGGVVTDAAGRFTLRGLGSGTVELGALARGYSSREPTAVELGIGEAREGVEILVDPSRLISGYVVRAGHESEGVPGVLVGGIQMKGGIKPTAFDESDETGYFEILGLAPGKYGLVAAKDGLLPNLMRKVVDVGEKDVTDVLLVVEAGATLRGRVEPASMATLGLQAKQSDVGLSTMLSMASAALVHARAGEDGVFELRGVPQGAFTLVARADDGRKGELPVVVRLDDQDGLVIKLETRAGIAGQVVDAQGAPVLGVEVNVWREGGGDGTIDFGELTRGEVRSGEGGRFEALGLEPGKYHFSVRDDEGSLDWAPPAASPAEVELAAGEHKSGVVLKVEARQGVIKGRVVGEDGAPVADAWVTVRQAEGAPASPASDEDAPEASWGQGSHPVLTSADGRFRFEHLRDHAYDLSAEAAGTRGHKRGVKPGADVTIRLRPLAGLAGQVTVAGKPASDYKISVSGPLRLDKHIAADDGRYAFARLDPGKYDVEVSGEQGAVKSSATVTAGQTATLDLVLEPWGEITGTIVDAFTSKPLGGLNLLAMSHDIEGDVGEQAMGMLTGDGPKTDAQGHFRIGKLGPGKGDLVALSGLLRGFEPIVQHKFELKAGEKKDLGTIRALQAKRLENDEQGDLGLSADAEAASGRLVVSGVDQGGGAATAGVQANDVVVSIDGHAIADVGADIGEQLLSSAHVKPGQVVRLVVTRDGKPVAGELVVTARARPKASLP